LGQGQQLWHGAQGLARGVLGVGAGIGIYDTLTKSMSVYQERARGVLDVGARLNQQYDETSGYLTELGRDYHLLGHDAIAGMQALTRVTGGLRPLEDVATYAQAYRVPFAQAAGMAGALEQLTISHGQPFARLLATLGPSRRGLPDTPTRIEEALGVAGAGGPGMPEMPEEFTGRLTNLIQQMGHRYTLPGAATAVAGQVMEGLN
jgi:hypothetical protein